MANADYERVMREYAEKGHTLIVGESFAVEAAARKVAKDDVLPTYAAESMLRVLELDAMARDTFETDEEAAAWLRQPHPMLDGETPLDCAKSGFGAERVKDILNAVKYGGVV